MSEHAEQLDRMIRRHLGREILEALEDPDIEEVQVNPDMIPHMASRSRGMITALTPLKPASVRAFLNAVAMANNTTMSSSEASLAAVLPETLGGCRVQGFIPPITTGPAFIIRKPPGRLIPLREYVDQGSLSEKGRAALVHMISRRANIMVVGPTSSGKTTLCNALLDEVTRQFPGERILILEDTPEIHLRHDNCLRMQTTATESMRDLVRYSLRSTPRRIVVGEVRDGAARDLLDAWITGHPGGCGTVHGEDAQRGLERLAALAREATPGVDQRRMVAEAIQVVVFISGHGTRRKVRSIDHVEGLTPEQFVLRPVEL